VLDGQLGLGQRIGALEGVAVEGTESSAAQRLRELDPHVDALSGPSLSAGDCVQPRVGCHHVSGIEGQAHWTDRSGLRGLGDIA
jgi:hypothetical protein